MYFCRFKKLQFISTRTLERLNTIPRNHYLYHRKKSGIGAFNSRHGKRHISWKLYPSSEVAESVYFVYNCTKTVDDLKKENYKSCAYMICAKLKKDFKEDRTIEIPFRRTAPFVISCNSRYRFCSNCRHNISVHCNFLPRLVIPVLNELR